MPLLKYLLLTGNFPLDKSHFITANQSITFTYTDGTEGAISNYTAAPTPGSTEDGQVTGTYTFTKGPVPAPTAEAVQSASEACC